MNKFAKKISTNLKQFKVEPDSAWLVQTRQELAGYMNTAKIKPKRAQKFNNFSETFKLFMQPMPVALASFGLTLIIGSVAVSHSQTTLPGDALYPVKRASEQIVLSLTSNPRLQSGFKNTFESRRLAELSQLSKKSEPATLNNYKTNSVFVVSHTNNNASELEAAQPKTAPPIKLSQVTADVVGNIELIKNRLNINDKKLTETKAPELALAPVMDDTNKPMENFNNNSAVINSPVASESQLEMPEEEVISPEPATTEEQPPYVYSGGGGGNSSVSQPTTVDTNKNEIIAEEVSSDTPGNNTELQPMESNFETYGFLAVPILGSPILSEENTDASQEIKTPTPTTTDSLIDNNEMADNSEEEQSDNDDDNNNPAQDQPTEDPLPDETPDDTGGSDESDSSDDNNATNENDGVIINIESNYPR